MDENQDVWRCDGHENLHMEDERAGYWFTLIKGAPRDILTKFYDRKEN